MSSQRHHSDETSTARIAGVRDDDLKRDLTEAIRESKDWDEVRARLRRKYSALFEPSRAKEESK